MKNLLSLLLVAFTMVYCTPEPVTPVTPTTPTMTQTELDLLGQWEYQGFASYDVNGNVVLNQSDPTCSNNQMPVCEFFNTDSESLYDGYNLTQDLTCSGVVTTAWYINDAGGLVIGGQEHTILTLTSTELVYRTVSSDTRTYFTK